MGVGDLPLDVPGGGLGGVLHVRVRGPEDLLSEGAVVVGGHPRHAQRHPDLGRTQISRDDFGQGSDVALVGRIVRRRGQGPGRPGTHRRLS